MALNVISAKEKIIGPVSATPRRKGKEKEIERKGMGNKDMGNKSIQEAKRSCCQQ